MSTPRPVTCRHATRGLCTTFALLLFVVVAVPRPASAQILKKIKDAAAQKAAERAREEAERAAATAGTVADSTVAKAGRIVVGPGFREATVLPLRFALNSDSLAQDQAALLDVLATMVRQLTGNYRLDVYVTDWREAPAALLHSTRRAEAVRTALVARGVDPARLSAVGRGNGPFTRVELNPVS